MQKILFFFISKLQMFDKMVAITLSSLLKLSNNFVLSLTLPFFLFRFKADGKNCGPGPRKIKVRLNSQIYLVCPNMATVLQPRDTDVQTSDMWENIWLLRNKEVFDHCDVAHFPLPKRDKNLFICNNPTGLVFVSLLFLEFSAGIDDITFQGGNTYYLMGKDKLLCTVYIELLLTT